MSESPEKGQMKIGRERGRGGRGREKEGVMVLVCGGGDVNG